jgi:hypothetical protein
MKVSSRNRRQRSDAAYKVPRDPHFVTLNTRAISLFKQKKTAKLRALGYTDTQIAMIQALMKNSAESAAYAATQGAHGESESIDGLSVKRSGKTSVVTFHYKPV